MDSLSSRIAADFIGAMRAKEEHVLGVLRMLKTAIHNREIEKHAKGVTDPLTDDEVQEVVIREAKKRTESREVYRSAGRDDLAATEELDLSVLKRYLPEPATPAEIEAAVTSALLGFPNATPADIGKVMGAAMKPLKGRVTPDDVSKAIRAKLG